MIRAARKRIQITLAACAVVVVAAVSAQAEMIDINITGFRIDYSTDDDQLHDRKSDVGGSLNPVDAVGLTGTEFMINDNLVEQYNVSEGEDTYADLLVSNITPTLTLPTLVSPVSLSMGGNDDGFGFDWFYDDGGTMRNLRLNFEAVTVALIYNGNAIRPTVLVTGTASSWSQSNLPGGLAFNAESEISFSYTTSNTMAFGVSGVDFTDLLGMGGVMQISGDGERIIPEPATVPLALFAICIMTVVMRWRLDQTRRYAVAN
jgi:hypothetical protein